MITKNDIDHGKAFDWGRTSDDYAKFRDIYPDIFYDKIIEMGLCVKGQRVLDLGTGTGVLPRNLYKHGAEFTGSDIAENQIEQARRLSAETGMNIEYVVSPAETVDFPDSYFDVITACQCFIYFDKDVIGQKLHRLLKDGGHFCKLSMIWLPCESEIAQTSENIVLKYNPTWTGAGFTRKSSAFGSALPDCLEGLFEIANSETFDVPLTFTRESWHGRMKACRGIGASSLSAEQIAEWEREHIAYLQSVPEIFDIPHFVIMLNMRKVTL
jgi:SAM-dependent methyltransferase